MSSSASFLLRHSRRTPLPASAIALFAVSATSAWATPPAVTNCNDSGDGSLRAAVAGAVLADTIDMSTLPCSTITLSTGAITVGQKLLTIKGAGRTATTIEQTSPNSRVIVHNYYYKNHPGHLYLQDLRVGYGYISSSGPVHGGCVASLSGFLTLNNVGVYHCSATTTGLSTDTMPMPNAFGGAVFGALQLTIAHSTILHGTAEAANAGVRAQGGCAFTFGTFHMADSSIAYCQANGPAGSYLVRGGALELKLGATITGSIVAKAYSNYVGGIDLFSPTPGAVTATISNSTITYNSAHGVIGGMYANSGQVYINNSTIAFNTAGRYTYTHNAKTYNAAVGVSLASAGALALSLQSTIIANNSSNGTQEDLSFGASTGLTVAASNNLVRAYMSDVTLPSGQGNLTGVCPLLGPIRDNGGVTFTHALQSGSPAINAGNNTAIDPDTGVRLYDQRGMGYARVSDINADIGAYEVQKSEIVFDAGFDGCP